MKSQLSITGKEPWLAVSLSTVFPGFGHIYAGKLSRGLLLIFITLILFGLSKWLILSPTLRLRSGLAGSVRLGTLLELGDYLLYFFSLFDAYRCTKKGNRPEFESLRKSDKDPWKAVFLTRIAPGFGHIYGKKECWHLISFYILVVGIGYFSSADFYWHLQVALRLLAVCFFSYDAYLSTPTHRAKSQRFIARVCLILLVLDLSSNIVGFSLKEFVVDTHCITTNDYNAVPATLKIGDCVVEEKISHHFSDLKRGDIVVFRTQYKMSHNIWNSTDFFIKRIIGLPNEKVEIRDGLVYINDKALNENYIAATANDQWDSEVIPDDTYFVFGTNHDRVIGQSSPYDAHMLVPRDNITGKATKISWLPKRMGIVK